MVHVLQQPLNDAGENVLTRGVLQKFRAHHRRQRQGDKTRHHNGAGKCQREFEKEPPGASWRKGNGGIDGSKRQRHGHHGECYFTGAPHCRIEGLHAFFNVPIDIFEHDYGVVNHKADGQHEGQQRQRVDGKARRIHDGKGGNERHGDCDDGDDCGAEGMEKQEDNENNQGCRFKDRFEYIVDGAVDKDGRVKANFD